MQDEPDELDDGVSDVSDDDPPPFTRMPVHDDAKKPCSPPEHSTSQRPPVGHVTLAPRHAWVPVAVHANAKDAAACALILMPSQI